MARVNQRNGLPKAPGFPDLPQALLSRTLGELVSRADESRMPYRSALGGMRLGRTRLTLTTHGALSPG